MLDLTDCNHPRSDPAEAAVVQRLFDLLSRHRQIEFHPFAAESPESTAPGVDPGELLKFLPPVGRDSTTKLWDQIENLRQKKRKNNPQIRELLKTIAMAVSPDITTRIGQAENRETNKIEITNISMAGSVALIGVGLQATFDQGRLSNLIDHGEKLLPGEAGRSVFTLGNKRELLQTDSAFSFDREGQTGLRSVLSGHADKKGKGVQVILDYYFSDERGCLALDVEARYSPALRSIITEATPLELCLCSFSEDNPPTLEVTNPKGDVHRETVAPDSNVLAMWGKRFRLQHGNRSVELQAAPSQQTRTVQIEFRIEKKRSIPRSSTYLLWVNLGGSYLPQSAVSLSGRRLNLSYGIRFSAADGRRKRS
jgi:hypothetical protein